MTLGGEFTGGEVTVNHTYLYTILYLGLSGRTDFHFGLPTPLIAAEGGPKSATLLVLLPISAILLHQHKWISEKHEQSSWN